MGRGRNYERVSGSDRSESRGSYKRRRERSISLEDAKLHVKSPEGCERSKSPEVSNPEIDGSERGPEQSRSPQSVRSDLEGSPVVRERSRSPPTHQRSPPDGSPVRNGSVHSQSPTEKNDLDMENDRSTIASPAPPHCDQCHLKLRHKCAYCKPFLPEVPSLVKAIAGTAVAERKAPTENAC